MKNRDRNFHEGLDKSVKSYKDSKTGKKEFWTYVSRVTVIGWLFVLPVIAGAYLGRYLDGSHAAGVSWTITFIILGIAAGLYNVWHFIYEKRK